MATHKLEVDDQEIEQVLRWAMTHGMEGTTEHEDGTYEEGVADCIRWMLGAIDSRPDKP
ncbi:hypothetical protein [Marinobacter sp.]|uniref:hypothetical protein n=1 Tax=Marinobacter sp. TaxID=50741 RepID=UPI0034A20F04